ncbi:MAG: AbrB/MazE/SpoVT family DNA-binding domain-containing protein [Candidatus Thermoplasmatota archaeon]|jgi:AbrB family looped-hinge helix DNA binding protein|nr:AbrB/MazE/SpoVT family DNA-binding domain-containing protein [Candidatus Thermoplasmatota archaeon]
MSEVVKVTSKGQITLPIDLRRSLDIEKDGYLVVDTVGDYIIMKKAEIRLKDINKLFSDTAKRKKVTREDIEKAILKARKETWAG